MSGSVFFWFACSSSSSSQPSFSVFSLPKTWSRDFSMCSARPSSTGTEGKNTEAVSPGMRERTKRPIAWAKNKGVDAEVA